MLDDFCDKGGRPYMKSAVNGYGKSDFPHRGITLYHGSAQVPGLLHVETGVVQKKIEEQGEQLQG